jgi:hypothetical protein
MEPQQQRVHLGFVVSQWNEQTVGQASAAFVHVNVLAKIDIIFGEFGCYGKSRHEAKQ